MGARRGRKRHQRPTGTPSSLSVVTPQLASSSSSSSSSAPAPAKRQRRDKKSQRPRPRKSKKQGPRKSKRPVAEDKPPLPLEDLEAWTPFGLNSKLLQGLAHLRFATPTPIQEECLTHALQNGKDLIAAAETGSGKTLAFGLPMIHEIEKLIEKSCGNRLLALVLTPTRELGLQVTRHLKAAARFSKCRIEGVVGGISMDKQRRVLSRRPEIVVATPGRLWALIQRGVAKEHVAYRHLADMSSLRFLVMDEADRLVTRGHFVEVRHFLDYLYDKSSTATTDTGKSESSTVHAPLSSDLVLLDGGVKKKGAELGPSMLPLSFEIDGESMDPEAMMKMLGVESLPPSMFDDEDESGDVDIDAGDESDDLDMQENDAPLPSPPPQQHPSPQPPRFSTASPKNLQTLVFSATMTLSNSGREKYGKQKRSKKSQSRKQKQKQNGKERRPKQDDSEHDNAIGTSALTQPLHAYSNIYIQMILWNASSSAVLHR